MNYVQILKKKNITGPCVFVDLNRFDENAKHMVEEMKGTGLRIRLATKSIRVPELILRALKTNPFYQGLMCFSAHEAAYLATHGMDDFLISYPTVRAEDLQALVKLHQSGKKVSLVVDCVDHLQALQKTFEMSSKSFPVILELDTSLRFGPLVIGVRRSPLRSPANILSMIKEIKKYKNLKFGGIMAYEAHVAGVGDKNPFKPLMNILLKPLRRWSAQAVAIQRKNVFEAIKGHVDSDFIFNGGGTGSLSFNRHESQILTEVTAGSGLYCPHLFDYYSNLNLKPACFFALQVVRKPEADWFTLQGGGYVASGEPGWDRIPKPFSESGEEPFKLSSFEATGEVQTPVHSTQDLQIGDPVIFRHAKAGEVMERFNEVLLIKDGEIQSTAKTYRGYGQCYF